MSEPEPTTTEPVVTPPLGLTWMRQPWWVRALIGAAVALVAFLVYHHFTGPKINVNLEQQQMDTYLVNHGYPEGSATCPSERIKANAQYLCTITGVPGIPYFDVTIIDSAGDITFVPTQ